MIAGDQGPPFPLWPMKNIFPNLELMKHHKTPSMTGNLQSFDSESLYLDFNPMIQRPIVISWQRLPLVL